MGSSFPLEPRRDGTRVTRRSDARNDEAADGRRPVTLLLAGRRHTTPRGRGYPRDKSKAAGPLVLTLNASQKLFSWSTRYK